MMLKNLRTVNCWYKTMNDDEYPIPLLQDSIGKATDVGGQYSQIYFFKDIWIPRPKTYANKYGENIPEGHNAHEFYIDGDGKFEYKYENVGMLPDAMTEAYMTLYGYNKLSVPITDPDMLTLKMKSIFNLNLGKYMKWLDTMGYAYNPLWNVDGSESFQFIDEHGEVQRDTTPILQSKQELQTAPYDSETYRKTNQTETTYQGLKDGGNYYSLEKETHTGIPSLVNQPINGTLHAVTGGDYSHIEKRVRQGNIGVTMTTQLIEAERELVKFNLIQEFFRDINKQLLVGTYDGF